MYEDVLKAMLGSFTIADGMSRMQTFHEELRI